jgi:hypothetical protein
VREKRRPEVGEGGREEEEGGHRRSRLAPSALSATGGRGRESEERERGGGENLEAEAGAAVYILLSGF